MALRAIKKVTQRCVLNRPTHSGKTNGHECVDVGAALQQVDGNTGGGQVGWVNGNCNDCASNVVVSGCAAVCRCSAG